MDILAGSFEQTRNVPRKGTAQRRWGGFQRLTERHQPPDQDPRHKAVHGTVSFWRKAKASIPHNSFLPEQTQRRDNLQGAETPGVGLPVRQGGKGAATRLDCPGSLTRKVGKQVWLFRVAMHESRRRERTAILAWDSSKYPPGRRRRVVVEVCLVATHHTVAREGQREAAQGGRWAQSPDSTAVRGPRAGHDGQRGRLKGRLLWASKTKLGSR